jgi:predicted CxxxxCH...CXXCH cytochrome family protein
MASTHRAVLAALALLTSTAACDQARPTLGEAGAGAEGDCTTCHGDATRSEASALLQAAPPLDAHGSASGPAVGAHQAHLHATAVSGPVACAECHAVPTQRLHSNGQVDLAFGALARAGGASPAFAGGTCSGVYCHGATLSGGSLTAPAWGGAGPLGCGSCHGAPPPSHAAGATACASCHPGTVNADGTLNLAGGLHLNGAVDVNRAHPDGWADPAQHGRAAKRDLASCTACHGADYGGGTTGVSCNACHGGTAWQSNCTFCHGTKVAAYTAADLTKAAPPLGTQGETATTARAVGAHQAHLAGGAIAGAVGCAECHAVPADLGHLDGAAQVTFGDAARRDGAAPAWSGTTCASTYCHGSIAGAAAPAPVWTSTAGTTCASCHLPQSGSGTSTYSGRHYLHVSSKAISCATCHGTGYTASAVAPATHVDGTRQLQPIVGWNAASRSCAPGCHGSETW